ncbi:MAG: TilS substrate-binding domain-containing protein, partial [Kineosporiaceae bacterium]
PDAVRRRAVLAALREAGCPAAALSRRHVLAVDALIVAWHGQGRIDLPGGVGARRACGRLELSSQDQSQE